MNIFNTKPPVGQVVSLGDELLSMLEDAANNGLIATAEVTNATTIYAMDLLDADRVNAMLAAGPAAKMALDAIGPAFAPGDVIELRALDPAGGALSLSGKLDDPAQRAALEDFVRTHIARRNLYVGINPRRADLAGTPRAASGADVVARRVLVLDLDNKDAPMTDPDWSRTVDALRSEADPFLVVKSGNGVHVWVEIEPMSGAADVAASAGPLAAAMAQVGADNMADAARIIRLPFTPNLPNEAKRKRGSVVRLAAPVPGFASTALVTTAKPPVAALCAKLDGIAGRLGLPGRGGAVAAPSTSRAASGGGDKTGWAAPSAELLRMALDELPNQQGGAFDDRNDWVRAAHAVKGAATAGGFEAEGRDAFVEWSQQWGGNPDEPGRVWDTCENPHLGWGTIMKTLEAVNPAGAQRVKGAVAAAAFGQQAVQTIATIASATFSPVAPINANQIPPRHWLYGRTAIAGFISFLVAPGGAGKSALALVEAVAMASGRELLAGERPIRPLRVWMHNAEDDLPEMQRRLAATLQHYGMSHADLNGNLFMTSGRDFTLKLASADRNGPAIVPGVVDALVERAVKERLDVIVLDPLGALHTLPENSNEAANLLSGALREIAHRAKVAIIVLHHTGKAAATDMDSAGAGASRGASAFVDAARVVRQIVRMTKDEATSARFSIPEAERGDYFRVMNGKANLARAEGGRWLHMADVALGNGSGLWPLGDNVGVAERWTPPTVQPGTMADLARVQAALTASPLPPRADQRSPDWIGYLVASVKGLDVGSHGVKKAARTQEQCTARNQVLSMIDDWVLNGGLEVRPHKFDRSKTHDAIFVGKPAILMDDDDADEVENSRPAGEEQ